MKYSFLLLLIVLASDIRAQRILPIGTGVHSSPISGVWSMVEFDGKVVLGGRYDSFNGHERRHLQAWDGAQHHDLPGAFEDITDRIYSLIVHEGYLIAAGSDPELGNIARWDGSSWSMIGNGMPAEVRMVKLIGNELHLVSTDSVVRRLNGSQWEQIGYGFNGNVFAIEEFQGELFAAGNFTALEDGTPIARLAKWTGTEWVQVGSGFNEEVRSLMKLNGLLYVGGAFTQPGDASNSFPGWCRFTGSEFQSGEVQLGDDGVFGFSRFPDHLILFGSEASVIVTPQRTVRIPWRHGRAAIHYNGLNLLVAGDNGGDYRHWINGIAHVDLSGSNHAVLDLNDERATIVPTPSLFDRTWENVWFEMPKGSGHQLIYGVHPILRGEVDGTFHYSSFFDEPVQDDTMEFAGPRADVMDEMFYQRFHRVWKLDRAQVLAHQQHWQDPAYVLPDDILEWPAHGDVSNGEPVMLAPFADLNDNGIYQPATGEYPLLKGDRSTYHIAHSVNSSWFNGQHLPIDLHIECFAYEARGEAIDHTVFASFKVVNRSDQVYANLRPAFFTNMMIGSNSDDLVGCDTTRNLIFNYNGNDTDPGDMNIPGYDERPPAIGVKFLNTDLASHRRFVREGDVNMINGAYEAYLNDHMDGTHNGQPYDQGGYPMNFQFPGGDLVDDLDLYQGSNINDPRSVAGIGPFSFGPTDTLCFDLAFIYARSPIDGALASLEMLKLRSDSVQAFYDGIGYECSSYPLMTSVEERAGHMDLQVYPSPARTEVMIRSNEPLGSILVVDAQGRMVRSERTSADQFRFSIGDLPAGLYLVRVMNGRQSSAVRFVVE